MSQPYQVQRLNDFARLMRDLADSSDRVLRHLAMRDVHETWWYAQANPEMLKGPVSIFAPSNEVERTDTGVGT
jgi:hypothetical protein